MAKPIKRSDGKLYASLTDAARDVVAENGVGNVSTVMTNISNVARNVPHHKSAYGYGWEYGKPIGGVDSCRRYVRAKESNYEKLFGTPERAAKTLSIMQRCELGIIGNCEECEMHDACKVRDGDYDALLEWLRGDA